MPSRSPLRRILIGLGLLCGTLLALAGALALGISGIIAVLVAGVVSAALAAGLAREAPDGGESNVRESAVRAGAGTVGLLLVVSGTAEVAGGVVAAILTGLAAVGALAWWVLRGGPSRRSAPGARTTPATPGSGRPVRRGSATEPWEGPVSSLPTAALGREWLLTTAALTRRLDPPARQAIARRREEALDELERRDPAGFARWLAGGPVPGSDPADFVRGPVRGDQAAGTDAA